MKFFKQKPIIPPTKEALEKSIRNNLRTSYILEFVFFGFLTVYTTYYIRTGKMETELLIFACILAVFVAMYLIVHKIDKARLELYNAVNEED